MVAVVNKGASDAGAIFVKVNRLDGTFDLFGPAPQALVETHQSHDRQFECLISAAPEDEIDARLRREGEFDPDFWLVEVEDRQARHFLDIAQSSP